MIAALFVAKNGPYFGLPGVDPWDQARDARLYRGPHPVVAHSPCERWGRYWRGGPSAKARRLKGDDGGCFFAAIWSVRTFGGALEHPAHTAAWPFFGLAKPPDAGGWVSAGDGIGLVCHVEQGNYGHAARKATWLYAKVRDWRTLPGLTWGPCTGKIRADEGFHSREERARARAAGIMPIRRLSRSQLIETPILFRDLLLQIAARGRSA